MREYKEIYSLEGRTLETGWKVLHRIDRTKIENTKAGQRVCPLDPGKRDKQ